MPEENEIDANEDWDDEEFPPIIRAKWTFDGASTLSEAAELLVEYSEWLRQLESEGWQLTDTISGDYGFLAHPTKKQIED